MPTFCLQNRREPMFDALYIINVYNTIGILTYLYKLIDLSDKLLRGIQKNGSLYL